VTEAEWLACTDPQLMLEFLKGKASDRKLRLFACACCRSLWHLVTDNRSRAAVEVAERLADGVADGDELRSARGKAKMAQSTLKEAALAVGAGRAVLSDAEGIVYFRAWAAAHAARAAWNTLRVKAATAAMRVVCAAQAEAWRHFAEATMVEEPVLEASARQARQEMKKVQAALVRDIFGTPFHPVSLDPSWLTWHDGLLVSMARRMYDSRDFADMAVLADALEEASCDNADILNHCRQHGEHVRGCWVIDLLLGRS
jgi:hypothetical protein